MNYPINSFRRRYKAFVLRFLGIVSLLFFIYLVIDYRGPTTITLREDVAFGMTCMRARDLIVQEYDEQGNLWASRGMIIYRMNKGEGKFVRVAHVPTGPTVYWLRNFYLLRRFTVRPECIEMVQGKNGEICALSAGKMWYWKKGEKKFRKTLTLNNYGFGDQGIRNVGILRTNDSTIFIGEYFQNIERKAVNIYESRNNGITWEIAFTFKPGSIRHIHALQKDAYSDKLWICVGDNDNECLVAWSDNDYRSLNRIGSGSQQWRVCQLIFTKDAVIWGTDNGHADMAGIYRWDRNSRGISKLATLDGAVFFGTSLSNGMIVMSTDREGFGTELDDRTRIWSVSENHQPKSLVAGTWKHNKPGFKFKFAQLRFQRNQGNPALAISILNQKEFRDGELIIITEEVLEKIMLKDEHILIDKN